MRGMARVMLLPPDILLSELTAGGLHIPHAAWTEQATSNVLSTLKSEVAARSFITSQSASLAAIQPPDVSGIDYGDLLVDGLIH